MQYYKYKANRFPSSLKMGCACVNIVCTHCVHSVYIVCTQCVHSVYILCTVCTWHHFLVLSSLDYLKPLLFAFLFHSFIGFTALISELFIQEGGNLRSKIYHAFPMILPSYSSLSRTSGSYQQHFSLKKYYFKFFLVYKYKELRFFISNFKTLLENIIDFT